MCINWHELNSNEPVHKVRRRPAFGIFPFLLNAFSITSRVVAFSVTY